MKGHERGLYRRGNTWWVCYSSSDHKTIRESAGTLENARKRLSEVRSKNRKPHDIIKLQNSMTFRELFEMYRNSEGKKYVLQFENSYMNYFGDRKLRDISRADLYNFKEEEAHRQKKYGGCVNGTTVNRSLAGLRRLFNFAVNRELMVQNPFPGIKSGLFNSEKQNRARKVSFTEEEIYSICSRLRNPTIRAIARCSYLSGMRAGELMNFKWEDWDGGNKIRLPKTKSGEEQGVNIPDEMIKILNSLPRKSDYVFCRDDGSKLSWWHYFSPFKRSMRKVIGDRAGRWNFHTLRHSTGSNLHKKHTPLEVISNQLRHSDMRITRDFYVAESEEIQREAIEKLSTSQSLHNLGKNQENEEWVQ